MDVSNEETKETKLVSLIFKVNVKHRTGDHATSKLHYSEYKAVLMESTSLGTFRKAIAEQWSRMRTMDKRGTVTCILHG